MESEPSVPVVDPELDDPRGRPPDDGFHLVELSAHKPPVGGDLIGHGGHEVAYDMVAAPGHVRSTRGSHA